MTTIQLRTARHYSHSLSALQAMLTLLEKGPLPMGELAQEMDYTTAGMTCLADNLCKQGIIQREPSSKDRRSITLELTEKGRVRIYQITGREALAPSASIPL